MLPALGRMVRGLSALFWGLPLALLFGARTSMQDWLRPLGMMPATLSMGMILYGLIQMGRFQPQERIWMHALDRAKIAAWVNLGLTPFLHWWNRRPDVPLFSYAVVLLLLTSLLFLINLNLMLERLAAMLPDQTLREETQFFTEINRTLLLVLAALVGLYFVTVRIEPIPEMLRHVRFVLESARESLFVVLVLLPVALTMTLLWKTKETILASVFSGGR